MQLLYLYAWPHFLNTVKHPLALGKGPFMGGIPPPSQGLSQFCEVRFLFPCLLKVVSFFDKRNLKLNCLLQKHALVPISHPASRYFWARRAHLLPRQQWQNDVGVCLLKKPCLFLSVALRPMITFWKPKAARSVKNVCLGNCHSIKLLCKSSWQCMWMSPHLTRSSVIAGQPFLFLQCTHKLLF